MHVYPPIQSLPSILPPSHPLLCFPLFSSEEENECFSGVPFITSYFPLFVVGSKKALKCTSTE